MSYQPMPDSMTNQVQRAVEGLLGVKKTLEEELKRVDKALEALSGGSPKRAGKKCCTKREVIEVVVGLLRDNVQLTFDEIEGLAKDKIANERSKSLSGFAMRLKEALSDNLFVEIEPRLYALAARQ